jgi:hypothetical protein
LFQTQARAQAHTAQPHEASESGAYDKLLDRAIEAFDHEDFAQAFEDFEQAYQLRPNARVQRGLGIAALRLNRFGQAKRALSSALEDKRQALTPQQVAEVRELLEWMRTNLGTLNLHVFNGASAVRADDDLRIDNEPVRDATFILLSPGTHVLQLRVAGFEPHERRFTISAGAEERLDIDVRLTPSARAEPEVSPARAAATVRAPAPSVMQPIVVPSNIGQTPESHTGQPTRQRAANDSSVLTRWWFWTAVGVVAAGGAAAALLATREPGTKPYEQSSFGSVIMPLKMAMERPR